MDYKINKIKTKVKKNWSIRVQFLNNTKLVKFKRIRTILRTHNYYRILIQLNPTEKNLIKHLFALKLCDCFLNWEINTNKKHASISVYIFFRFWWSLEYWITRKENQMFFQYIHLVLTDDLGHKILQNILDRLVLSYVYIYIFVLFSEQDYHV